MLCWLITSLASSVAPSRSCQPSGSQLSACSVIGLLYADDLSLPSLVHLLRVGKPVWLIEWPAA